MRKDVYIVPTDQWYIERTVWLIAGTVLLASTTLALLVDRYWILLVVATGLASIAVALTGFCVIGNLLKPLGLQGRLAVPGSRWYLMQTDSWYLERRIYLVVGINLTIASVLSIVWTHWWLAFVGFVGAAMWWFAITGYCIMANGLYWLGAAPRLAPQCESHPDLELHSAPT